MLLRNLLAALVLPTFIAAPSFAASVYSTSFEAPTFTTGSIAGQDGWAVFGPGGATVENTFAYSGSQAVMVPGSTAGQSGPYHSDNSSGPIVSLSAELYIGSSTQETGWQFGALGPGLAGYLGGFDLDTAGDITAITAGGPVLGTFTKNQWNDVDLVFNMVTQTYSITIDGTTLGSGLAFCGSNASCTGATLSTFGTGFFDSFGGGNDVGYMDNYSLVAGSTPEPASLILVGTSMLGCVGVLRRRMNT